MEQRSFRRDLGICNIGSTCRCSTFFFLRDLERLAYSGAQDNKLDLLSRWLPFRARYIKFAAEFAQKKTLNEKLNHFGRKRRLGITHTTADKCILKIPAEHNSTIPMFCIPMHYDYYPSFVYAFLHSAAPFCPVGLVALIIHDVYESSIMSLMNVWILHIAMSTMSYSRWLAEPQTISAVYLITVTGWFTVQSTDFWRFCMVNTFLSRVWIMLPKSAALSKQLATHSPLNTGNLVHIYLASPQLSDRIEIHLPCIRYLHILWQSTTPVYNHTYACRYDRRTMEIRYGLCTRARVAIQGLDDAWLYIVRAHHRSRIDLHVLHVQSTKAYISLSPIRKQNYSYKLHRRSSYPGLGPDTIWSMHCCAEWQCLVRRARMRLLTLRVQPHDTSALQLLQNKYSPITGISSYPYRVYAVALHRKFALHGYWNLTSRVIYFLGIFIQEHTEHAPIFDLAWTATMCTP